MGLSYGVLKGHGKHFIGSLLTIHAKVRFTKIRTDYQQRQADNRLWWEHLRVPLLWMNEAPAAEAWLEVKSPQWLRSSWERGWGVSGHPNKICQVREQFPTFCHYTFFVSYIMEQRPLTTTDIPLISCWISIDCSGNFCLLEDHRGRSFQTKTILTRWQQGKCLNSHQWDSKCNCYSMKI